MFDNSFPGSNLRTEVTGSDLDDLDDDYYDTSDDSASKDYNDSNDVTEFNIDDGLLDSVFDELPGTGQTRPPPAVRPVSRPSSGYNHPSMILPKT